MPQSVMSTVGPVVCVGREDVDVVDVVVSGPSVVDVVSVPVVDVVVTIASVVLVSSGFIVVELVIRSPPRWQSIRFLRLHDEV